MNKRREVNKGSSDEIGIDWGLIGSGSKKDRHRGTSGAKEGFCSIGRFSKK